MRSAQKGKSEKVPLSYKRPLLKVEKEVCSEKFPLAIFDKNSDGRMKRLRDADVRRKSTNRTICSGNFLESSISTTKYIFLLQMSKVKRCTYLRLRHTVEK